MPDREKVIKALEQCTAPTEYGKGGNRCTGCPYLVPRGGFNQFRCDNMQRMNDALALLKEQEAVEPTWEQGKAYCGSCGKRIPLKIGARFCHKCGRAVKWNENVL